MNTSATYHFNPFSLVTQVDKEILINTSPANRVIFAADHFSIIDHFIGKGELQEFEVLKYIAPSRLDELLAKKVLLKGAPRPITGRYSRQMGYFSMISDEPDLVQQKVRNSHALILGVGAIGSHTCWNLAAIGVGKITLVDFDTVEESNFNRQLMYTPEDLGKYKVDVLGDRIREFNPEIEVVSLNMKINSEADVLQLISDVDIVVKAIDTPEESMEWVNAVCVRHSIPYVCGGFLDSTAVVGPNYIPGKSLCSSCQGDVGTIIRRMHGTGPTFGPLATLVTSMLSMIAFKILLGKADGFVNRIYLYNADNGTWDNQLVAPVRDCSVCGTTKPAPIDDQQSKTQKHSVLMLRLMLVTMLSLTIVIGEIYKQPLVGVMAFFGIFACVPVVSKIYGENSLRSRREFFVLTCIYMGFSIFGLLVRNLYGNDFKLPYSLREIFNTMQLVSGVVIQATLGITVLFFSLCSIREIVPRVIGFLNQKL